MKRGKARRQRLLAQCLPSSLSPSLADFSRHSFFSLLQQVWRRRSDEGGRGAAHVQTPASSAFPFPPLIPSRPLERLPPSSDGAREKTTGPRADIYYVDNYIQIAFHFFNRVSVNFESVSLDSFTLTSPCGWPCTQKSL